MPCWYQVRMALTLCEGKDVDCAPKSAGKTLSFWIPLLMAQEDGKDKMSFVVTPLNLLGEQNVSILEKAGAWPAYSRTQQGNCKYKNIQGKYYHYNIYPRKHSP